MALEQVLHHGEQDEQDSTADALLAEDVAGTTTTAQLMHEGIANLANGAAENGALAVAAHNMLQSVSPLAAYTLNIIDQAAGMAPQQGMPRDICSFSSTATATQQSVGERRVVMGAALPCFSAETMLQRGNGTGA